MYLSPADVVRTDNEYYCLRDEYFLHVSSSSDEVGCRVELFMDGFITTNLIRTSYVYTDKHGVVMPQPVRKVHLQIHVCM